MQSRTDWRALARIAVSSPPDRECKAASITKKAARRRPFCVSLDMTEIVVAGARFFPYLRGVLK